MWWITQKRSPRKTKPKLEPLDRRDVPATIGPTGFGGAFLAGPAIFGSSGLGGSALTSSTTFGTPGFGSSAFNSTTAFGASGVGGTFFNGPATLQSGSLAFSTPAMRAFDLGRANLINRSETILARQNTLFGTGFSPFATNFNNFTGPAALNTGPSIVNFARPNLFNQTFNQAGATRVNPLDALLAGQRSQFGANVVPFSNRPFFSTFNNVNPLPNTLNESSRFFRNEPTGLIQSNTPVTGVIPTNPTYPLNSNGFFRIVQTPGGPAGLR